jgi:D-glycero-alpha-D-manno-heptose-7-phosphate kinase
MTSWVRVQAPVRVLDVGGWSDTWFAGHGQVCQLGVGPGTEVEARLTELGHIGASSVQLHLPDFDEHYSFSIYRPPGRHPMLEAALRRWAPAAARLEITVSSPVPTGSGLGTSASVLVALIAALQELDGSLQNPDDLASAAHNVETVDLARQSGVQDQVAAARGGANFIKIAPYPRYEVEPLELAPATWQALTERVSTVYLGVRHDSSAVHDAVISQIAGDSTERFMSPLRAAADAAAGALVEGDLGRYGDAMIASNEAQAALHRSVVSPLAWEAIDIARRKGAVGWKVNGAGGDGGTVSFLGPEDPGEMLAALDALGLLTVLDLQPAREGAHVVDRS